MRLEYQRKRQEVLRQNETEAESAEGLTYQRGHQEALRQKKAGLCMRNGSCSKQFPKKFSNAKTNTKMVNHCIDAEITPVL